MPTSDNLFKRPIVTIEKCPNCKRTSKGEIGFQITTKTFFFACHNPMHPSGICNNYTRIDDPNNPIQITVTCGHCDSVVTDYPFVSEDTQHLEIACHACGKKTVLY